MLFLEKDGYLLELVEPINGIHSDVDKLRKRIGNNPYHICYEVQDINTSINKLQNNGFTIVQEANKASAIQNKNVAFMFSSKIGMVELLEGS